MKFTLSTIVMVALASLASSAAVEKRASGHPLPARFGLVTVAAHPLINGFRLRYYSANFFINNKPEAINAIFLGGNNKVTLDPKVHPATGYSHTGGAWNLGWLVSTPTQLRADSEEWQAVLKGWGGGSTPVVDGFVMDDNKILRRINSKGELKSDFFSCDYPKFEQYTAVVWVDEVGYMPCEPFELKVIEI